MVESGKANPVPETTSGAAWRTFLTLEAARPLGYGGHALEDIASL
jgi:hypothetical protein